MDPFFQGMVHQLKGLVAKNLPIRRSCSGRRSADRQTHWSCGRSRVRGSTSHDESPAFRCTTAAESGEVVRIRPFFQIHPYAKLLVQVAAPGIVVNSQFLALVYGTRREEGDEGHATVLVLIPARIDLQVRETGVIYKTSQIAFEPSVDGEDLVVLFLRIVVQVEHVRRLPLLLCFVPLVLFLR